MRIMPTAVLAALALSFAAPFANASGNANPPLRLAQAGGGCAEKCEQRKEQCLAQYTATDARGNRYVTPDGHKTCWNTYHDCMKSCPKK